jgi:putative tryptophan/tyrosine transport system substrate-binding protein
MLDLRRRQFITLLGGAAVAWPLAARAQRSAVPVIGVLSSESPEAAAIRVRAFHQGLSEVGFIEGRDVVIEYLWAKGQNDRLPTLAADLVHRQVVAIACLGGPPALAAKAATTTIPIVFQVGFDPVELGLVTSLNRPGGNITGLASLNTELVPKRLEVLHQLTSTEKILGLLVNPTNRKVAEVSVKAAQAAAESLGLQLHILYASNEHDFDAAFATLPARRVGGLAIVSDPFFLGHSQQLAALALHHTTPALSPYREFALAGGLISYGSDLKDQFRLVGVYIGRILKGEKPADLPVQQASKVELIINLKTAKMLGLTVPTALLVRADEVIE